MFDLNAKVVCVDDRFPDTVKGIYTALPKRDAVYTVRDIVPAQDWKLRGTCAVYLGELVNPPNPFGIEPGFQCHRFRELEGTELELALALEKELTLTD